MKFVLIAHLCLFSLASFSNENEYKENEKMIDKMSLEDAKAMKIEMIDKKSAMLDQGRKCINDAKDKTVLKNCMREMWENKSEMKDEMRDKMKKR